MRVYTGVKETYRRVGEFEFDEINPYIEAIGLIKHNYPGAKIIRTKTVYEPFGAIDIPLLKVWYEE